MKSLQERLVTELPGIIGLGVVGQAMADLFEGEYVGYDPRLCGGNIESHRSAKEDLNACPIAFVCVPTPMLSNGSCDTSIVKEVVGWCECPLIVIRSTVAVGTTDRLKAEFNKRIVFQPEYLGETVKHPLVDMASRPFVILGGDEDDTTLVADFYKRYYNAMVQFFFADARTAELCKYMENSYYATKVTFVNEFYELARTFGVDFNQLRELWLADPRISRDHSFVYPQARGFAGKCLPKDVNALVHSAVERGYEPALMQAVLSANDKIKKVNRG